MRIVRTTSMYGMGGPSLTTCSRAERAERAERAVITCIIQLHNHYLIDALRTYYLHTYVGIVPGSVHLVNSAAYKV